MITPQQLPPLVQASASLSYTRNPPIQSAIRYREDEKLKKYEGRWRHRSPYPNAGILFSSTAFTTTRTRSLHEETEGEKQICLFVEGQGSIY